MLIFPEHPSCHNRSLYPTAIQTCASEVMRYSNYCLSFYHIWVEFYLSPDADAPSDLDLE